MKFLVLLLLCSCFPMEVYRVGRHERIIDAYGNSVTNGHHLAVHAIRKSELMKCHRVKFLIVSKYHVQILCMDKH